jgi:hypothetical protein
MTQENLSTDRQLFIRYDFREHSNLRKYPDDEFEIMACVE